MAHLLVTADPVVARVIPLELEVSPLVAELLDRDMLEVRLLADKVLRVVAVGLVPLVLARKVVLE
jgi:hypothetical protein